MIDPLDRFTRTVTAAAKEVAFQGSLIGTFVADEDLTLRQVHFFASRDGSETCIVSTDPQFKGPSDVQMITEFQLDSQLATSWIDLVFPLPKGKKLYLGATGLPDLQRITLIFT